MKRLLLTVLVTALCLASCTKTKEILRRSTMFGTMQSAGVMLGDDGNLYRFSNYSNMGEGFPDSGRIVAMFDVFRLLEGSSNEYSAEVINYSVPLYKLPVSCETEEEDAALGDDPIRMTDGITSGGHLNLLCGIWVREGSSARHSINLQVIPSANTDTLHFVLRHDAGEDKMTDSNAELLSEYPFYASFPLQELLPEGKPTVIEVRWNWNNESHVIYGKTSR